MDGFTKRHSITVHSYSPNNRSRSRCAFQLTSTAHQRVHVSRKMMESTSPFSGPWDKGSHPRGMSGAVTTVTLRWLDDGRYRFLTKGAGKDRILVASALKRDGREKKGSSGHSSAPAEDARMSGRLKADGWWAILSVRQYCIIAISSLNYKVHYLRARSWVKGVYVGWHEPLSPGSTLQSGEKLPPLTGNGTVCTLPLHSMHCIFIVQ